MWHFIICYKITKAVCICFPFTDTLATAGFMEMIFLLQTAKHASPAPAFVPVPNLAGLLLWVWLLFLLQFKLMPGPTSTQVRCTIQAYSAIRILLLLSS